VDLWRGKHVAFFFVGVLKKVACEQKTTFFCTKSEGHKKSFENEFGVFLVRLFQLTHPLTNLIAGVFAQPLGVL